MPTDPENFAQAFSDLTNSLQIALALSARRARAARVETAERDQLHAAISRAVEAAQQLRPAR
jgi:hypothetical protein